MAEFAEMVTKDYGIRRHGVSKRNPQANAIIKRVCQAIGNIIRTFQVQENYLEDEEPWNGILAATMFAICATYRTTIQATPSQLVFRQDAILNTQFEANWNLIREHKQKVISDNNKRENAKRVPHEYKINDKVLYRRDELAKYQNNPYEGPYKIVLVNDSSTVRIKKGAVYEILNIRLIKPYHE